MENITSIISLRKLTKVFGSNPNIVTAIDNVNMDVVSGEFVVIAGKSGSGKTTLLNLMAGLDKPTSGQVFLGGTDLNSLNNRELIEMRRHKIGFIYQSFGLLPLLSTYENIELPLHIAGIPRCERRKRSLEMLEMLGLSARMKHRPFELSGGEQQRVSIARAFVSNPAIIFADEPTAELDIISAAEIGRLLKELVRNRGITAIVATHDIALSHLADRVTVLVDGHFTT